MAHAKTTIETNPVSLSSSDYGLVAARRVEKVFSVVQQPAAGLDMLAIMIQNPPTCGISFTVNELDEIVDGKNIESHKDDLGDGDYLSGFLVLLEWWKGVSKALLAGRGSDLTYQTYDDFPELKKDLGSLICDVLDAYKNALANTVPFQVGEPDDNAHIELLKRYRLFTRYVCAFARELWPEVNLEQLSKLP